MGLYEIDFYEWTQETARIIRQQKMPVDAENVAEEIDSLGRRDRSALNSNLAVLVAHLLKYEFQPELRSGSWRGTIFEHRMRVNAALEDSPSLRAKIDLNWVFRNARIKALTETGLDALPGVCPYSIEEILDDTFLPG